MNYISRVYDLNNEKDLKLMEKEQQRLYKKYRKVEIVQVGLDKYRIRCSMI